MQYCTTPLCDAASIGMTALQLGQFVPQHLALLSTDTIVGLSPWLLFFSSIYNHLAALDLLLVNRPPAPTSVAPHALYRFFMAAQPAVQLVGSAALTALMWPYYLARTRRHERPPAFGLYLVTAITSTAIALALTLALAAEGDTVPPTNAGEGEATPLHHMLRRLRNYYATACGLGSAIGNTFMWLPQIALTSELHASGSLSTSFVVLSIVADVVYIAYLAARGVHWSVWVNNVPDGVFAGVLLVLIMRYKSRGVEHTDIEADGERLPLLLSEEQQQIARKQQHQLEEKQRLRVQKKQKDLPHSNPNIYAHPDPKLNPHPYHRDPKPMLTPPSQNQPQPQPESQPAPDSQKKRVPIPAEPVVKPEQQNDVVAVKTVAVDGDRKVEGASTKSPRSILPVQAVSDGG